MRAHNYIIGAFRNVNVVGQVFDDTVWLGEAWNGGAHRDLGIRGPGEQAARRDGDP